MSQEEENDFMDCVVDRVIGDCPSDNRSRRVACFSRVMRGCARAHPRGASDYRRDFSRFVRELEKKVEEQDD